jgi:EpsI family protein
MIKIAAAFGFLMLNAYIYHFFASEEVIPARQTFDEFPLELGDWKCARSDEIPPGMVRNLGVTDYLNCHFVREGSKDTVGIYLGYHASQVRREGGGSGSETPIHPPKHCLPGSGWSILDLRRERLELPGLPEGGADVNRLIIANGNRRQIVYYWYHSRGRVIAEDWQKIVLLFWDRARRQRTDGSLVRFTIPLARGSEREVERAEEAFTDLASRIVPRLAAYVPE